MNNCTTLNRLKENYCAKIVKINDKCNIYCRLCDFGITNGTIIKCVKRRKGIAAYFAKGTVLALRDIDTQNITILLSRDAEL